MGRHGLDCSGSGYGQVSSASERGNEISGFIKCWELDYLRNCYFLGKKPVYVYTDVINLVDYSYDRLVTPLHFHSEMV